jgi:hypothetical protein
VMAEIAAAIAAGALDPAGREEVPRRRQPAPAVQS